eukprot:TRINITY_DN15722_c0_g1_i2.p1 TRINITY_DN15722_c0_g1~~TRINITY_DN15722_c0_g1_i2.p1  ORF type:complete len:144 (+),score=17.30 TRINITY_DN15722_c0_g1_i2:209-640(+)
MSETTGPESSTFGPAHFSYTIVYVKDVLKAVEFYHKAFGLEVRRFDDSRRWAELETGKTTLAFTPLEQREAAITGGVHSPGVGEQRSNVEICITFKDVDAAFKHAVATGAQPVAAPEHKEWGQKVGYVRDQDGVSIRLGTEMS